MHIAHTSESLATSTRMKVWRLPQETGKKTTRRIYYAKQPVQPFQINTKYSSLQSYFYQSLFVKWIRYQWKPLQNFLWRLLFQTYRINLFASASKLFFQEFHKHNQLAVDLANTFQYKWGEYQYYGDTKQMQEMIECQQQRLLCLQSLVKFIHSLEKAQLQLFGKLNQWRQMQYDDAIGRINYGRQHNSRSFKICEFYQILCCIIKSK